MKRSVIAVAGERMHLVEAGPADAPPLLLSSGVGGAHFDWTPTIDRLSARYRVCCFDRPGLGLSPPRRAAPSLRAEVAVLAGLAEWLGRGRPLTVLAHSAAAFHAEALARLRPELVHGLVLIDPSHADESAGRLRLAAALTPATRWTGSVLEVTRLARVLGPAARRLMLRSLSVRDDAVPAAQVRAVYGRGEVLGAVLAENAAFGETAADLSALRLRRPFPPIPLVVITALGDVRDVRRGREWTARHRRLAAMSPHGIQVTLPAARHLVQYDRPDAVAEAVTQISRRLSATR